MENKTKTELQTIGEKVVQFEQKKKQYAQEHYSEWLQDGLKFQQVRKIMRVSQAKVAKQVGCSVGPIRRLEKGLPIRRRNVIRSAYFTILRSIYLEQLIALSNAKQTTPNKILAQS